MVVFTGAGVSQESGLKTFRDEDGLWMGYDINEVATIEAWKTNRRLVQDFYNMRRREVMKAQPNDAHTIIARLQDYYDVWVITQNIDDLHERAGSKKVLHLHGEIMKMRSDRDPIHTFPVARDLLPDERAVDGGYLRPHVVWFGEDVPAMGEAASLATTAEIFLVVGSSLQVYPAAGLAYSLPLQIPKFLIDPKPPQDASFLGFKVIKDKAGAGMRKLRGELAGQR